ncbi:MFS transporter [Steroidobacter flavus]|uniref:MFS transporter n=1 Tax=Steroidobacter flavus TaxID=1842136 RepID=A0ABV8T5B0_9GAMM
MASSNKSTSHSSSATGAAFSVYAGGLILGMTLVSVPASSALLKQLHGFSDAQYGAIYLPQLLSAIVGGVAGGMLTTLLGTKRLLVLALLCLLVAQFALAASATLHPDLALAALMITTGCIGLGIGLSSGPLNAYPVVLFPAVSNTALTALHTIVGVGMMLAPLYLSTFAQHDHWLLGVLVLSAVTLIVLLTALLAEFPPIATSEAVTGATAVRPERDALFWICAAIAVIYSVAEGIFSNWAMLFIQEERGLDAATASLALTCFWGALTSGRLLASFLVIRLPPLAFLLALPPLMTAAFCLLPLTGSAAGLIGAFAFAGLACSAYFPMLVAYAAGAFPQRVAWIASMMITAQMVGIGLGTYTIGLIKGTASITSLYYVATALPAATLILIAVGRHLAAGKSLRVIKTSSARLS